MRKIKRVKIGQYILATKYRDKDFYDPWAVGEVVEWGENYKGFWYVVSGSNRIYKHAFSITPEEGAERLKIATTYYPDA